MEFRFHIECDEGMSHGMVDSHRHVNCYMDMQVFPVTDEKGDTWFHCRRHMESFELPFVDQPEWVPWRRDQDHANNVQRKARRDQRAKDKGVYCEVCGLHIPLWTLARQEGTGKLLCSQHLDGPRQGVAVEVSYRDHVGGRRVA